MNEVCFSILFYLKSNLELSFQNLLVLCQLIDAVVFLLKRILDYPKRHYLYIVEKKINY